MLNVTSTPISLVCCSDNSHFRADIRYNPASTTWYHFDPYGFPEARILRLSGDCPVAEGAFLAEDIVGYEMLGARDWFQGNTRAEVTTVVYVLQQSTEAAQDEANPVQQ